MNENFNQVRIKNLSPLRHSEKAELKIVLVQLLARSKYQDYCENL